MAVHLQRWAMVPPDHQVVLVFMLHQELKSQIMEEYLVVVEVVEVVEVFMVQVGVVEVVVE